MSLPRLLIDRLSVSAINTPLSTIARMLQNMSLSGLQPLLKLSGTPQWKDFTPSNRVAQAGTWTLGTFTTARYFIAALPNMDVMRVVLHYSGGTLSAAPTYFAFDIPEYRIARATCTQQFGWKNNAGYGTGTAYIAANSGQLRFQLDIEANGLWPPAADVGVGLMMDIELVQKVS